MGLPVLASAVGGVPEIIRDGENGLLVRPHDVRQLVQVCPRLIGDVALRKRLGARAAETVRARDGFLVAVRESGKRPLRASSQRSARREQSPLATSQPIAAAQQLPGTVSVQSSPHGRRGDRGGDSREISRCPPLSAVGRDRVRRPGAIAGGRRGFDNLGVFIDEGCHTLPTLDEKAAYLVTGSGEHGIRLVVACQDTLLAHRVFEQLDAGRVPADRARRHRAGSQTHSRRPFTVAVGRRVDRDRAGGGCAHFADRRSMSRYLPSMVDVAEYWLQDRDHLRDGYGFGDDIVVVFVGRLDAKKGIDHLHRRGRACCCRSCRRSASSFVGPPDAFQPDHAQHLIAARADASCRRIGSSSRARATTSPRSSRPPTSSCCRRAARACRTSINEAGAAGLPVVAFDDGAAAEQLDDGTAGVLVPPGDVPTWSRALRTLAIESGSPCALGRARCATACSTNTARSGSCRSGTRCSTKSPPICRRARAPPAVRVVPDDSAAAVSRRRSRSRPTPRATPPA